MEFSLPFERQDKIQFTFDRHQVNCGDNTHGGCFGFARYAAIDRAQNQIHHDQLREQVFCNWMACIVPEHTHEDSTRRHICKNQTCNPLDLIKTGKSFNNNRKRDVTFAEDACLARRDNVLVEDALCNCIALAIVLDRGQGKVSVATFHLALNRQDTFREVLNSAEHRSRFDQIPDRLPGNRVAPPGCPVKPAIHQKDPKSAEIRRKAEFPT